MWGGAGRLVLTMCLAEVVGMAGFATFAALLPDFLALWTLSNTEAGWISGIIFAGYVAAVPVLVSLTDRVDPRRIYLWCTLISAASALAFALAVDGFWSALVVRALAGVGLAGTYMPGLKILSDRLEGARQARATAFYTASFGIGVSLSYLLAGELSAALDWRWAFAVAAFGSLLNFAIASLAVAPAPVAAEAPPESHLLDFGRCCATAARSPTSSPMRPTTGSSSACAPGSSPTSPSAWPCRRATSRSGAPR